MPREGMIFSGKYARPVSYETMMDDVKNTRIVYIGENHSNTDHHRIQLQLLRVFFTEHPGLAAGMEMFDRSYQPVLDKWSAGRLPEQEFLQKTHWYANWKFDYSLYREILAFISEKNIPLYGLNIPFHLPAKIAVGGIDSLSDADTAYIPMELNTSDPAHRDHVRIIFDKHPKLPGRDDFERFYTAQCVWEDVMAETIAQTIGDRFMVVLVGNGHIIHKFGIPDRAFKRTGLDFRTIVLTPPTHDMDISAADYTWITAASTKAIPGY